MTVENEEQEAHRLRDIVTNEVSTVDRAANKKKRFLVVKRRDEMTTGAEVQKDKDGNLIAVDKMKIPGPVKEAVQKELTTAIEMIRVVANKAKTPIPEDESEKFKGTMAKIADLLDSVTEKYKTAKADDAAAAAAGGTDTGAAADGATDGATDVDKQKPDTIIKVLTSAMEGLMSTLDQVKNAEASGDDATLPPPIGQSISTMSKALRDLGEKYPTTKSNPDAAAAAAAAASADDVAKRGAKMKASRLEKLKAAFENLKALMDDIVGQPGKPEDTKKFDDLVEKIDNLVDVVSGQQKDLSAIKKTRDTPASVPVDGAPSKTKKTDETSWPLDMNRPISPDTVSKDKSFY